MATPAPPSAVDERDLHGLGWWVIKNAITGELTTPQGTVVANVMRVLAGLGPEPLAEEEALRNVELSGRIMHGVPPRNEAEWERARRMFDDDAIAEFERWAALRTSERLRPDCLEDQPGSAGRGLTDDAG